MTQGVGGFLSKKEQSYTKQSNAKTQSKHTNDSYTHTNTHTHTHTQTHAHTHAHAHTRTRTNTDTLRSHEQTLKEQDELLADRQKFRAEQDPSCNVHTPQEHVQSIVMSTAQTHSTRGTCS